MRIIAGVGFRWRAVSRWLEVVSAFVALRWVDAGLGGDRVARRLGLEGPLALLAALAGGHGPPNARHLVRKRHDRLVGAAALFQTEQPLALYMLVAISPAQHRTCAMNECEA